MRAAMNGDSRCNSSMRRIRPRSLGLKSNAIPTGVAEYQLKRALPARLRGKPPTAKQLEDAIRGAMPGSR